MEVIYGNRRNETFSTPLAVGLGNFDGLHVGHMVLINTLISESGLFGLKSMVYTFTKHPENILRKKLFTPLLATESKKIEILSRTALDYVYFDEFDEDFSRMEPEAFVKRILVDKLKIKLAVAGFNYRFGYKGEGDGNFLKALGKKYNFRVVIIPPIKIENEVVSSTLIRNYVKKGDMEKAFKLLGRHYSITGQVVDGRKIGSRIGFPTANIHPEDYLVLPHDGVYITKTCLEGNLYPSITNIGKNPTFNGNTVTSVETHILDFNLDIYEKKIEVFFISRLRGEKKFRGKDELVKQIKEDIQNTRKFFNATLTKQC